MSRCHLGHDTRFGWCPYCPAFFDDAVAVIMRRLRTLQRRLEQSHELITPRVNNSPSFELRSP